MQHPGKILIFSRCFFFLRHTPKPKTKPRKLSCRRAPSNEKNSIFGYIMISSCPSSWRNADIARACLSTNYTANPAVALPVLDVTTNVTYANIYCAMCHGKSRDLHLWSLMIQKAVSHQNVSIQDIRSADAIWNAFPIGDVTPEKCLATPSEANMGPKTKMTQLCHSYANSITVKGRRLMFKNTHCALLSDSSLVVNQTVRCGMIIRFPPRMSSVLFTFSTKAKTPRRARLIVIQQMNVQNCQTNEVYDPFQEKCLPVHSDGVNTGHINSTHTTNKCWGPRFPSHEFRVLSNNSVIIIPYRKLYNNDSFILVNQTLILCSANVSRNYSREATPAFIPATEDEKSPNDSPVLRIITYAGFSLSIISLLFLLMTYVLFAELRTYAGKRLMHLSCALIAMQSAYFVSDPDIVSSSVCAVIAALLHYFILAVFLWMSVIADDTQRTFSSLSK